MSRVRRPVAVVVALLGLALLQPGSAQAAVSTASGASADTTIVCQRLSGIYSTYVGGSGFHYARLYGHNRYTGAGFWTDWTASFYGRSGGISLPRMGTLAVYFQYAYWNGSSWEIAGEWAKLYNARGEHVGYYC